MAERRMFTKKITDDDNFITLPSSAQALYFHLNQGADDDGFNNQVQIAMWKAHASIDDLKVLMAKNYILRFESGVIVIKHWRMHNTLRKDRYTPTNFQEELRQLGIKDNGSYTLGCHVVAEGLPDGCPSIGKVRKGKESVVEGSIGEDIEEAKPPKPTRHKHGSYNNVLLTDEEYLTLQEEFPHDYMERIERLSEYIASSGKKYKSHLATIRTWARKDADRKPKASKSSNPFLDLLVEEGDVL